MIVKIQYQEKDDLICVYDDVVKAIKDNEESEVVSKDDTMTFVSGNLNNSIAYIKEEQKGIFDSSSKYSFDEIAKEMYTYGNIIGINIGTEMYFVNTNGMLIKKYVSKQEITNVMMSNNLAIIIYKDRIEIVNL